MTTEQSPHFSHNSCWGTIKPFHTVKKELDLRDDNNRGTINSRALKLTWNQNTLLDQFLTDKNFYSEMHPIEMRCQLFHADMFMLSLKMWARGCERAFIKRADCACVSASVFAAFSLHASQFSHCSTQWLAMFLYAARGCALTGRAGGGFSQ